MAATNRKAVSLGYEVRDLEDAVSASLLLIEVFRSEAFETEEQASRVPAALEAVLRLVGYRLHHLGRVTRGLADAETIWSASNDGCAAEGHVCIVASAEGPAE